MRAGLLILLLCAVPPSDGVTLPPRTSGGATARLTVRVADAGPQPGAAAVRLTLTVVGGPLLSAEPARLSDPVNGWEAKRNAWCRLDGRRLTWTESILLRQTKPGQVPLPDVSVRFRDGSSAPWAEAEWADVLKSTRGPPAPEHAPASPAWPWWWAPAALLAALAALAAGISRRLKRPAKSVSAGEQALRELDRLGESAADVAAFHTALSDVVRRLLAERLGLPATRRTTAEFLASVRQAGRMSADEQALLRDFLERCDLAKFAPVGASSGACREAAALARALVRNVG